MFLAVNRFVIVFLSILFVSCSDSDSKPESNSGSNDTSSSGLRDTAFLSGIRDTFSASKRNRSEFKGEVGFLSSYFEDTFQVRRIQKYVNQIGRQKFKDSLEFENEEFIENLADGGGSLTGYFQDGKLLLIKEWIGLSYGVTQRNFYFNKDRLAYVLELEDHFYVDSSGTDHSGFDQHFRGDYYFSNNKLVDMVSLGHNRFEIDTNDPEREFLQLAVKYKRLILNKRKGN